MAGQKQTQRARAALSGMTGLLLALLAIPTAAQAGRNPIAIAEPFWYEGNVVSGGQLIYRFNLVSERPGSIEASAKVKGSDRESGTKWKADFPLLHQEVTAGQRDIISAPIPIPAGFAADAKLQIRVKFDGKTIGKGKLVIHVSEPAEPPVITESRLDVGFDTEVELSANSALATPVGKSSTYTWTQTNGLPVVLSDPHSANPTFRTHSLETFVELEDSFGLVGISTKQAAASTYVFNVTLDSAAKATSGTVTIVSASKRPPQPTVPLGENCYFRASAVDHPTYSWSLVSVPPDSMATLSNAGTRTPHLRPDAPGPYIVRDNVSGEQITVSGAEFVGVAACALCHGPDPVVDFYGIGDVFTPWSKTGHASILDRGLDGILGEHYSEACITCHTVGYNTSQVAVNNGFDDLAAAAGWHFPAPLQSGNAAAMPDSVYAMANVQCESCHGPGSTHPGAASESLSVEVCATCHDDGSHHNRPSQWALSAHAAPYSELSEEEGTNSSCARCHSGAGYLDTHKGEPQIRAEAGALTCQTCHDPHGKEGNEHQLRVVDSVTLANGLVLTGLGTSATCVECHNARRGPESYLSSTPHGGSKAELFYGVNLYDYGEDLGVGVHSIVTNCIECHMAPTPGDGDPMHNKLGDHTFNVSYHDADAKSSAVVENVSVCNRCHGANEVTTFNYRGDAFDQDADGDGVSEGVQSEVQGLLDTLITKLVETGVTALPSYPYWSGFSTDPALKSQQRAAVWNHDLVKNDKSLGVHNPQVAIAALQRSYTHLSQAFGGPSFGEAFPNASLR